MFVSKDEGYLGPGLRSEDASEQIFEHPKKDALKKAAHGLGGFLAIFWIMLIICGDCLRSAAPAPNTRFLH
jgi:hypothetical protein